jgi:DNA polymerase-3 subunit delta'
MIFNERIFDLLLESQIYKELKADKERNSLSHAYLVLGPDTKTRNVFKLLASLLILCEKGGCLNCPTCRSILATSENKSHLDIKEINEKGDLKVEDLTGLIDEIYTKPVTGDKKIFFIDNLEIPASSQRIQNKLLKIYEEPPKNVVIFMMARGEAGVLPTIISRAKSIYLPSFTTQQIYDALIAEEVPEYTAEMAASLSSGRFDKADLFADKEEYIELFENILEFLVNLKNSKDVSKYLNSPIFKKDNLETAFEIIQIILNDALIKVSGSNKPLATMDRDYYISEIAKMHNAGSLALAILATTEAKKMLTLSVNETSIAESFMLNMLQSKYKATL